MKKKLIALFSLTFGSILLTSCLENTATVTDVSLDGNISDALTCDDPISSSGEDKVLVVPLNLNETYTTSMLTTLNTALTGSSEDTGYYSLAEYINISSYNKLSLDISVSEPLTSTYTLENYTSIIEEIKDSILNISDISSFDTDGDSYIDSIYFVYANDSQSKYEYLDRYTNNFTKYVDISLSDTLNIGNVSFVDYATLTKNYEGFYDTESLLVDSHELIHQFGYLLGLQDTYDFNEDEGEEGGEYHSTMMSGITGDFSSSDKTLLGWTTVKQVDGNYTIYEELDTFESSGEIIIWSDHTVTSIFDEYFIIEIYTNTLLNKDNCITGSDSIAVVKFSHVNNTLRTNSNGKIIKVKDNEYNDSAFLYDNSISEYLRVNLVLTKDYVEDDGLTDESFITDIFSYNAKFQQTNSYGTLTLGLASIEDDTAVVMITV